MSLARYAKRRDENERHIVEALESAGAEVWILDRPADLLVWFRQLWFVMEVKTSRGRLSQAQRRDRDEGMCQGICIVRTPVEALRAIGAVSNDRCD